MKLFSFVGPIVFIPIAIIAFWSVGKFEFASNGSVDIERSEPARPVPDVPLPEPVLPNAPTDANNRVFVLDSDVSNVPAGIEYDAALSIVQLAMLLDDPDLPTVALVMSSDALDALGDGSSEAEEARTTVRLLLEGNNLFVFLDSSLDSSLDDLIEAVDYDDDPPAFGVPSGSTGEVSCAFMTQYGGESSGWAVIEIPASGFGGCFYEIVSEKLSAFFD